MPSDMSPIPVVASGSEGRKMRKHFDRWPAKALLSVAGTILLTGYICLFFWQVPLLIPSLEGVVYSWGGVLATLMVFALLKAPRVMTQTSGDEWVPVTEILSITVPLLLLAFIAGRTSASAMKFPDQGLFALGIFLVALIGAIVGNVYYSMRLAERTYEGV